MSNKSHPIHGGSGTLLYGMWRQMLRRCYDPGQTSYKDYGGRGITVCQAWHDFGIFRDWAECEGYQVGSTEIDRRDVNGNYCPDNCRWRPRSNNLNKRTSRLMTAWGETKQISEWANDPRCVVAYDTLHNRIEHGMDIIKAITLVPKPHAPYKRKKSYVTQPKSVLSGTDARPAGVQLSRI